MWMSHVTYEWVRSNMNESRHRGGIFFFQTTALVSITNMNTSCHTSHMNESYEGVMSHMNESCHIWMSHVKYESVTSQGGEILAPDNSACSHHTYEYVMSHVDESYHIWMSYITYEWVISYMSVSRHIWMSHVTYEWVTSQYGNIPLTDDSAIGWLRLVGSLKL